MKYIIFFIIIATAWVLLKKILPKFKVPKVGAVALVTGAVKSGKSTFSFILAYRNFKKRHRRWYFRKIIFRANEEEPLFYSNIPVKIKHYVPLSLDMIRRKTRLNYGSVTWLDEASLIADSQLWKDQLINEEIQLFMKLYGHETKGGILIYNTQSYQDLHYGFARCTSQIFFVHHTTGWLPFLGISKVRELVANVNDNTINVVDKDLEEDLLPFWFLKTVYKKFDCYAFSYLTDDLPREDNQIDNTLCNDLKAKSIVSFRNFLTIKNINKEELKKENKDEKNS